MATGEVMAAGWKTEAGKSSGRVWSLTADGKPDTLEVKLPGKNGVRLEALLPTAGGGWLLAGTAMDPNFAATGKATWLKLDAGGKLIWQREAKLTSSANAAVAISGGRWRLAGSVDPSGANPDGWLWPADGFGNVQWAREFDGGALDTVRALTVTTDTGLAAVGDRAVDGTPRGLLVRADAFGHASCATAGGCVGKELAACDDGKPCTADDCHASAGCTTQATDTFACDPQDGCSLDGACSSGACKPGVACRLYQKTFALGAGIALGGVVDHGTGNWFVAGHDTSAPAPKKFRVFPLDAAGNVGTGVEAGKGGVFQSLPYPIELAAVVPRGGGGLLLGGSVGDAKGEMFTAQLMATNANGSPAWVLAQDKLWGQIPNRLHALTALPDGTFTALADYQTGFAAARVKASGEVVWKSSWFDAAPLERRLQRAAVIGGSHLIGGGKARSTILGPDEFAAVRIDGTGQLVWSRYLLLAFEPGAVVAGTSQVTFWGSVATPGLRPARVEVGFDGKVIGVGLFSDPAQSVAVLAAVARGDGSTLLGGVEQKAFVDHAWLGAVDASGELLWSRSWKTGSMTGSVTGSGLALIDDDALLVGRAVFAGVDQGFLLRTDRWGHESYPLLGACAKVNACDDEKACTAGHCEGSKGCIQAAATCDDANPCTADSCDPS
jgi:hypothetical protein